MMKVVEEIDIEEIDIIAPHRKSDMSGIDRIIVNDKVFLAADKMLDIIIDELIAYPLDYHHIGHNVGANEALMRVKRKIEEMKGEA